MKSYPPEKLGSRVIAACAELIAGTERRLANEVLADLQRSQAFDPVVLEALARVVARPELTLASTG